MSSSDYETRAKDFGFATKTELESALKEDGVVILDVRTQDEIGDNDNKFTKPGVPWLQSKCTATQCEFLSSDEVTDLLPNKDGPIIIYCRSGRRASTAKRILQEKGYKQILNAGGYDDVVSLGL